MRTLAKWLLILAIALAGPVPVLASAQAAGCAMPASADESEDRGAPCCDRSCILLASSCPSCAAVLAASATTDIGYPTRSDVFPRHELSMIMGNSEPPEPPPPRHASI